MILIQAHRGASAYAPENTLPAFRRALELGADGVECDIHVTADGRFVLCHDGDIARTSDGSGAIADLTIAQLKERDFGAWFGAAFAGTRIPTLEEFIGVVGDMAVINIEIKGLSADAARRREEMVRLTDCLSRAGCLGRVLFSCFNHAWLGEMKALSPSARTALLYGERRSREETLALAAAYGADALHPQVDAIDRETVDACRRAGIDVNVWTVNDSPAIDRALALCPTGVITDRPDALHAAITAQAGRK